MAIFGGGVVLFFSDHLNDKIWAYNFAGFNLSIFGTVKIFYRACGVLPAAPGHFKKSKYPILSQKQLILEWESPIFFSEHLHDMIWVYKFTNSNLYVYEMIKKFYGDTRTLSATLGILHSFQLFFQQLCQNFKILQSSQFLSYRSAQYMKKHIFLTVNKML